MGILTTNDDQSPLAPWHQPFALNSLDNFLLMAHDQLTRTVADAYYITTGNAGYFKVMNWHRSKDANSAAILATAKRHLQEWLYSDAFYFYAYALGWKRPREGLEFIEQILNADTQQDEEFLQKVERWLMMSGKQKDVRPDATANGGTPQLESLNNGRTTEEPHRRNRREEAARHQDARRKSSGKGSQRSEEGGSRASRR